VARTGGWRRQGSSGRFRYVDARGTAIADAKKLERIGALVIPPAWKDVWISPRPQSKLQATGVDAKGRRQYLYSPVYRAEQEQAKYDKLVRFAERLPVLRGEMAEHMAQDSLERDRVCALAVRLINLTWFRVGSERYAAESKTFGVTTLTRRHVRVEGKKISFHFRAKHGVPVRTALIDAELAEAISELLALRGGRRLFRYRWEGDLYNLGGRLLNQYISTHLGAEFTAKDFRTWGGTLTAAIAFAERGLPKSERDGKRAVASVTRTVAGQLGNTPAVARTSYISPAIVEQYLDGTTIDKYRPRRLRVVAARDAGLDLEEQALLSLLRSWKLKRTTGVKTAA